MNVSAQEFTVSVRLPSFTVPVAFPKPVPLILNPPKGGAIEIMVPGPGFVKDVTLGADCPKDVSVSAEIIIDTKFNFSLRFITVILSSS